MAKLNPRFRLVALVATALAARLVSAAGAEALTGWTYVAHNHNFSGYVDATGKQLCDGVRSAARGKTVIFKGGKIVIDIALAAPANVSAVTAHVHRHNSNYKLERWTVHAREAGNWVEVGAGVGFWGERKKATHVLSAADVKARTDALRLTFYTPHLLSISEIEVFGSPISTSPERGQNLPFLQTDEATARELDADADGQNEVVLENALVRLIFQPDEGGVCTSFVDKRTGLDMVTPLGRTYGLLRDQLWDPYYFFAERFYSAKTEQGEQSAAVELSTSGVGGIFSFTRVSKRIELTRDSPVVRVRWELLNEPSSQTDYAYAIWFHNTLGVKGRHNHYYAPTEDGVQEFGFLPSKFKSRRDKSDIWYRSPARGWTAFVAPMQGQEGAPAPGLGIKVEYKRLNCFYHWVGASSLVATHEWRLNKCMLKAGERLTTNVALVPFTRLPRLDGVFDTGAAAITFAGGRDDTGNPRGPVRTFEPGQGIKGSLHLEYAAGRQAQVELRLRRAPKGQWTPLAGSAVRKEAGAQVQAAVSEAYRFSCDAQAPGLYVLGARIVGLEREPVEVERPFRVGQAQVAYRLEPKEKRIGAEEVAKALPGHELTDRVVTPHFPWARPYAGGQLKGLVLCDDRYSREIVELAQRLDLKFDYVKFYTTLEDEWLYHGDRSILSLAQAQSRLQTRLKQDFDFMLVSGFKWDHHFTPAIRKAIVDKVRQGTGLIVIQPDGFECDAELVAIFGGKARRGFYDWKAWRSEANHPLTQGLPWDLFPVTRRMVLEPRPQGEVLAAFDDGYPLLLLNQLGRGRVVTLTYDVLTHMLSYRGYAGLTPILSYRGGWLRPQFADMTYPYWEYWYALLARCCVWAANKETGVSIVSAPAVHTSRLGADRGQPGSIDVTLQATSPQSMLRVTATLLDRHGRLLPGEPLVRDAPAPSRPGRATRVALPLPAQVPVGRNLAHLRVLNEAGQVLAWAATTVHVDSPLALERIELTEPVLKPKTNVRDQTGPWDAQGPLEATVKVRTKLKPPGRTWLECQLRDNHDRLLGQQSIPVQTGKTDYAIEFPLRDLVNSGLELRCELMHDGQRVDSARARAIAPGPRTWRPLQFTSWRGVYYWRSKYLYDALGKRIDDFGLDVAFEAGNEFTNRKHVVNYWNNAALSMLDLLRMSTKAVPGFVDKKFSEKSVGYQKTRDRKFLVREPCLNDPEWRGKVRDRVVAEVTHAQEFGGAHDYCMGDEMSLTHYTRYHDYCWSEHCLGKFRRLLRDKYGTVGKLNSAWETAFNRWDEVVPMTLEEAKGRRNAAPWAEHRQFMDTTLQQFCQFIQRAIREVDPHARCGLSGTQAPEAGNGMDWWKMCSAWNFYHSYNTGQSEELRRSFAPATGLGWSPYYAGYWQSGRRLESRMFYCLLHDTTGISAWTTSLFFYGDMTQSEAGRDTSANLAELKAGIWDQFRAVKRQHDGIAIHYSHPSIQAALLLGKERAISAHRSAWVCMIEDMGLQYGFISYEQLGRGELTTEDYRVLVLPMSIALSPGEVRSIRDFVAHGGSVIADAYCGLMDDLCRRQERGLLDDVFGIKHPGAAREPGEPGVHLDASLNVKGNSAKISIAEPGIVASTAKALGRSEARKDVMAVFAGEAGKGRAWYLNVDLSQYETERKFHSPTERALHQIVSAALAEAGVKPKLGLSYDSGAVPHVEVVRYGSGEIEYLGLLRAFSPAAKDEILKVRLPQACDVYDLRARRALGRVQQVRVPMAPGQCRLYALASVKLGGPSLRLLTSVARPGQRVPYEVEVAGASEAHPRVVHVTVTAAEGQQVEEYGGNLTLTAGPQRGYISLCLSDTPGTWVVEARDVTSGRVERQSFRVLTE